MFTFHYLIFALLGVALSSIRADEPGGVASLKEATAQTEADWVDDRWSRTEVGPFLHATIQTPGRRTPKAMTVKVGDRGDATICFDTDTMRYVAGWTGGFLKLPSQRYGVMAAPSPSGEIKFATSAGPGWALGESFTDPRPRGLGPLPRDWAHYKGMYFSGKRAVFKYTVGKVEVLDSPWFENVDGAAVFTRTLQLRGHGELALRLGETIHRIATKDGHAKVKFAIDASSSRIIPGEVEELESLARGGPARWGAPLVTRGLVGKSEGPFAIDTLTVPYANPWNALMFTSGHDFLPSGEALVSTIHGDVWLVAGIDRELRELRWKRFATGLYQPLGVKVREGKIFVMERDQITVLHDLNADGEADFYENFNNDTVSGGGSHSYTTSLETDSQGNFYFTKCAEDTPQGGTVVRVAADGSGIEVIATGFRNPNGMGVGPGDIVTVADQQGDWVPETRLDQIRPGGFYGYMPMHKRATAPSSYDAPLSWIPRSVDNSAGGQVWVPAGTWGQLGGQMLHLSYGRCTMMLVARDGANGGIVPLPGRFLSGVMRGRFHDRDLFLTGLRGWQTAAIRDGCFQRARRTEAPLHAPVGFKVRRDGLELEFDTALDDELARDPASYAAEQWNYKWTQRYGSPDFSQREPGREGRDKLQVSSATALSANRILLRFDEPLRPVHVVRISYNLESAEAKEVRGEFYATINELP